MSIKEKKKNVRNTITECVGYLNGIKFDLMSTPDEYTPLEPKDEDYVYKIANELLYLGEKINHKVIFRE